MFKYRQYIVKSNLTYWNRSLHDSFCLGAEQVHAIELSVYLLKNWAYLNPSEQKWIILELLGEIVSIR